VFKGAGLIYGGDPVLLGKKTSTQAETVKIAVKKITKYSWLDEEAKVKYYLIAIYKITIYRIYIETD
jgi:hypothetical protein